MKTLIIHQDIHEALAIATGKDRSTVRKFVQKASASHETPVPFHTLFQEAYSEWMNSTVEQKPVCVDPLAGMESYEDLRKNGFTGSDIGNNAVIGGVL